jgi:hypothetical protein
MKNQGDIVLIVNSRLHFRVTDGFDRLGRAGT